MRIAVAARYDDNILQLSERDKTVFEANPQSTRFRITSIDDNVGVLSVDARWRMHPLSRRQTILTFAADAYKYAHNDIKSYDQFGLTVTQELSASRRHLTTAQVWFRKTPSFYLRQLTDDDASFSARRRIREELTYAEAEYGVGLDQEILDGRLRAAFALSALKRNYNTNFNERDGTDRIGTVTLRATPFRTRLLALALGYGRGTMSARGDLPSSPFLDDDISYDHRNLAADASLGWLGRAAGHIAVGFEREIRGYTTENPFDTSRYGRSDLRRSVRVGFVQSLGSHVEVGLDARRLTKHSSYPVPPALGDEESDFVENRYSFGVTWRSGN